MRLYNTKNNGDKMFLNYLENTAYLLFIVACVLLFLPNLRALIIKGFARAIISTYFGEGIWLKRNDLSNKEEYIHLMYLKKDGFVITRTSAKLDPISVDEFRITEHPNHRINPEKQIIIPK